MNLNTPIDVAVATAVAGFWNDDTVPIMNKIQLLKFGRTLDLDPTKPMSEKVRLIQEWVNESVSGITFNT